MRTLQVQLMLVGKCVAMDLLEYQSEEEEDDASKSTSMKPLPPPPPGSEKAAAARVGKRPPGEHNEGMWPSVVFIEVPVDAATSSVFKAYSNCAAAACTLPPSRIRELDADELQPHISLSKTLLLRMGDIDGLHVQLREALSGEPAFQVMLEGAQVFVNEAGSRSFVGLLPADGMSSLSRLTERVDGVAQHNRLPKYYDPPLFHASVAWAEGDITTRRGSGAAETEGVHSPRHRDADAPTSPKRRRLDASAAQHAGSEHVTASATEAAASKVPDGGRFCGDRSCPGASELDGGATRLVLISPADVAGAQEESGQGRAAQHATFVSWTVTEVCFRAGNKMFRIPLRKRDGGHGNR